MGRWSVSQTQGRPAYNRRSKCKRQTQRSAHMMMACCRILASEMPFSSLVQPFWVWQSNASRAFLQGQHHTVPEPAVVKAGPATMSTAVRHPKAQCRHCHYVRALSANCFQAPGMPAHATTGLCAHAAGVKQGLAAVNMPPAARVLSSAMCLSYQKPSAELP